MAELPKDDSSSGSGSGATTGSSGDAPFPLPRVTIKFCTQCKWMLRAAYYAQELLSTFSASLGEVALQPSTGGTFIVEIFHQAPTSSSSSPSITTAVLWDRKTDGGFPETKELKRRVRNVIEPGRNLGHVDREHAKPTIITTTATTTTTTTTTTKDDSTAAAGNPKEATEGGGQGKEDCEDCK